MNLKIRNTTSFISGADVSLPFTGFSLIPSHIWTALASSLERFKRCMEGDWTLDKGCHQFLAVMWIFLFGEHKNVWTFPWKWEHACMAQMFDCCTISSTVWESESATPTYWLTYPSRGAGAGDALHLRYSIDSVLLKSLGTIWMGWGLVCHSFQIIWNMPWSRLIDRVKIWRCNRPTNWPTNGLTWVWPRDSIISKKEMERMGREIWAWG